MSESEMRRALGAFEHALDPLVPDASARAALVAAVYDLINATLNHVIVIVNQRAAAGTLAPYPVEQAEDDPTGTDAGAHPRG